MLLQPDTYESWLTSRQTQGYGGRFFGVYPAIVTDVNDPDGLGRVKVELPWSPDGEGQSYETWARLATLMAGPNQGAWFIPDEREEVLVCFEAGDPRHPYVVGALWNGQDQPPETMDNAGENNIRKIHSRNDIQIIFEDKAGQETLTLETPGGQTIILKDGPGSIECRDSNGNTVKMESAGITVTASAKVTINASMIEVSAGIVKVDAGMSKFSGVVQADTVISNSVVSASYTPGAGNIW